MRKKYINFAIFGENWLVVSSLLEGLYQPTPIIYSRVVSRFFIEYKLITQNQKIFGKNRQLIQLLSLPLGIDSIAYEIAYQAQPFNHIRTHNITLLVEHTQHNSTG